MISHVRSNVSRGRSECDYPVLCKLIFTIMIITFPGFRLSGPLLTNSMVDKRVVIGLRVIPTFGREVTRFAVLRASRQD